MQAVQSELNDTIEKLQLELKTTRLDLSQERRGRVSDIQELTKARAELATTQHELNAINSQAASRSTSDASHYKERAKLQAELGAIKRANEVLQAEKIGSGGGSRRLDARQGTTFRRKGRLSGSC